LNDLAMLFDLIEVKLHSFGVLQAGSTRAAPAPRSGQTAPNR
jgi:hypothetical protein